MSWTKHVTIVKNKLDHGAVPQTNSTIDGASTNKYASVLPEVYAGHPNRIQRYYQYEDMSRDSDISAALDTIADFCTQSEEQNDSPFNLVYEGEPTETEIKVLDTALKAWVRKNQFRSRLWKMFRDCVQNGDAFFVRDKETHEWIWIDHFAVELVKMSDDGRETPVEYLVRNFKPMVTQRYGTAVDDVSKYRNPGMSTLNQTRPLTTTSTQFQMAGQDRDHRNLRAGMNPQANHVAIKAEDIIHLSLSEGMDINFPFGKSILDPVFKTYKQKEMIEDSVIIYRVQRAPERRVFYIDVGGMNDIRAAAYIERIKHDIHQRRIPNRSGGGSQIMDTAYNPLSMLDDYFFAQTPEGRGSKVEVLPSGDALGEITDLTYFTKKMARGLRIPTSYLSLGDDDSGGASYNDGKLGAALIQEYRFNKFCMRLQSLLAPEFDRSFKEYIEDIGEVNIPLDSFEIRFNPPQNFTKYRQIELDAQQTQVYNSVSGNQRLSERFKLKRFLNLTDAEILENERLFMEENPELVRSATGSTHAEMEPQGDLGSVGFRPDMGGDDLDMGGDEPDFDIPDVDIADSPPPAPEGGEPA